MNGVKRVLYVAEAHVTGGRAEGHGRTSDGALEVDLRSPPEMGGSGGGTNPEQLIAVGWAACFDVTLPSVDDPAEAEALVRAAHEVCPYSRATRGNVDVLMTVNGHAIDQSPKGASRFATVSPRLHEVPSLPPSGSGPPYGAARRAVRSGSRWSCLPQPWYHPRPVGLIRAVCLTQDAVELGFLDMDAPHNGRQGQHNTGRE